MKTVDFSETIEAFDLKVGRYRQLDFLRNYCADLNQTLYESFQVQGMKFF